MSSASMVNKPTGRAPNSVLLFSKNFLDFAFPLLSSDWSTRIFSLNRLVYIRVERQHTTPAYLHSDRLRLYLPHNSCTITAPAPSPQWNSWSAVEWQLRRCQLAPTWRSPWFSRLTHNVFTPETRAHHTPMRVIKWSSDCRWWQLCLFMRAAGSSPATLLRASHMNHLLSALVCWRLILKDWYWNTAWSKYHSLGYRSLPSNYKQSLSKQELERLASSAWPSETKHCSQFNKSTFTSVITKYKKVMNAFLLLLLRKMFYSEKKHAPVLRFLVF